MFFDQLTASDLHRMVPPTETWKQAALWLLLFVVTIVSVSVITMWKTCFIFWGVTYWIVFIYSSACPFSLSEQFVPVDRPLNAYGFRPGEEFFYNYNTASRWTWSLSHTAPLHPVCSTTAACWAWRRSFNSPLPCTHRSASRHRGRIILTTVGHMCHVILYKQNALKTKTYEGWFGVLNFYSHFVNIWIF